MSAPANFDDRAAFALMVLNLADIVQVSDEHIWVSITREDWEALYPPAPMLSELTIQPEVTP